MVKEYTEDQIKDFLKIPLERRIEIIDETYELIIETMTEEGKKAFEYLRNLDYDSENNKY